MSRQIEALLLDDDIWSLRLIKGLLQECFPDMKVHARDLPDPQGEFDIYFVDNDFNGRRVLPDLARDIRRERPQALIIAFSATLDAGTLKELINAGCDGACDKSVYGDLARTMEIVRAYIEQTMIGSPRGGRARANGAMGTVRDLLREWNRRLERDEQRARIAESAGAAQ